MDPFCRVECEGIEEVVSLANRLIWLLCDVPRCRFLGMIFYFLSLLNCYVSIDMTQRMQIIFVIHLHLVYYYVGERNYIWALSSFALGKCVTYSKISV